MSSTPQPYPVVYNADEGALQYVFPTGPIDIPEAPLNAITALTGGVTATGPGSAVATLVSSAVLAAIANGSVAGNLTLTHISGDTTLILHAGGVDGTITQVSTGVKPLVISTGGLAGLVIDPNTGFVSSGNLPIKNGSQGIRTQAEIIAGTHINNASAVLQADSTTQGFLPPRMTTTQRNAIVSPATGLSIYDTTTAQTEEYNGTVWHAVGAAIATAVAAGTGTVTPDASAANTFNITVSGALTLNGPSNPIDGQKVTLRILNDGSHSVTLATGSGNYRFGTDIISYTNSVSLTDYVGVVYNLAALRWDVVSVIQGF